MANNITFKVGNENSLPSSKTTGQLLFALNGSSGSIYYDKDGSNRIKFNADALKLANKVSINDTNFDGSEGIVTNKWGKVREFSISDSANWNVSESISVDGSTNVTLKMPSTFKMTKTQSIVIEGNANTYYPVVIGMPMRKDRPMEVSIHKDLGSQTPSSYEYNHESGTSSLWLLYEGRNGHWDGNGGFLKTLYKYQIYATLVSHAILNTGANGDLIVWLRGGGCYYEISTTVNTNITIYYSETNLGSSTYPSYIAPRTDIGNGGIYTSTYYGYGNLSGDISGTASAVRDRTSGATTYLNYGASGLSTTEWFAAWNGYELRGISPVTSRITMSAMAAVEANGFYGMGTPNGTTNAWIRTTSLGIIPYQSGGSSALGTESWPFNSVCTNNLYCYGPIRVGNNANGDTNYIAFYGTTGDDPGYYIHTFIGENLYGGSEGSELVIFKGNDIDNDSGGSPGPDRIRHIAGRHLFQTYDSPLSGSWATICDSAVPVTKFEIRPTWIRAHVTTSIGTDTASYALNTVSFICDSWIRTKGETGWYNESYGGGWHMNDTTWIRAYNDKRVYVSNTNSDAIYTAGGVKAHGGFTVVQSDVSWNIQNQNSGFTHYVTSATTGHWFNKAVYVQGNIYAGANYSDLVLTTANYSGYLDPRYVNVSGDTMTDTLYFSNTGATSGVFKGVRGIMADNDYWRVGGSQTATNAGYLEIATGDDGNEPIYVRQYSGAFSSLIRTATLLDGSGNTTFPGKVTANNMYATTGVYYGREATIPLLIPAYIDFEYSHVDSTNTSGDHNYKKGAIKLLCQNNRGLNNVNVFGAYHPNSQGPLIGQIYSTSTVDSTTGLPQYSTFWGCNLSGSIEIFGTNSYTYYHKTVLDTSNYSGILDDRYLRLTGGTMTGHLYATSGLTWYSANWQPVGNITCTPTANNQEWSIDVGNSTYTGSYFHIWSGKNGASILQCYVDDNRVVVPNGIFTTNKTYYAKGGICVTSDIIFDSIGDSGTSGKLTWNGSTDGANIYYRTDGADMGRLVFNLRDDANTYICFAYNGTDFATINTSGYYSGSAASATFSRTVLGSYTSNGGQQNPNYFGTNRVGFLMMNTTVNSNSNCKDWIIMDCYSGNDVGGGVAFGVNRQQLGAYIMGSDAARTSWTRSAELYGTHNIIYSSTEPTAPCIGAIWLCPA